MKTFEVTLPRYRSRHNLWAVLYGGVLLAWLTPEDNTLLIVSGLGAGASLLGCYLLMLRFLGGQRLRPSQWIPGGVMLGMLAGFGAVWATIALMIFKNAWHSHVFLDFPGEVIVGISQRVIAWTVAGGLLGGAAALLVFARHPDWQAEPGEITRSSS